MNAFKLSLTWFTSAREHAELAAAKLRWLEADPEQLFAEEQLNEAADQLRLALNRCEDTARTIASRRAQKREAAE